MIKIISRPFIQITILSVSLFSCYLHAQESAESLISEQMCYACHHMSAASIGPPWQAIAARHNDRKQVMTDVLSVKIIKGGGGNWGLIPMVPNQRVNAEEASLMAQWILDQTP